MFYYLITEDGYYLTTEDGDRLIVGVQDFIISPASLGGIINFIPSLGRANNFVPNVSSIKKYVPGGDVLNK